MKVNVKKSDKGSKEVSNAETISTLDVGGVCELVCLFVCVRGHCDCRVPANRWCLIYERHPTTPHCTAGIKQPKWSSHTFFCFFVFYCQRTCALKRTHANHMRNMFWNVHGWGKVWTSVRHVVPLRRRLIGSEFIQWRNINPRQSHKELF